MERNVYNGSSDAPRIHHWDNATDIGNFCASDLDRIRPAQPNNHTYGPESQVKWARDCPGGIGLVPQKRLLSTEGDTGRLKEPSHKRFKAQLSHDSYVQQLQALQQQVALQAAQMQQLEQQLADSEARNKQLQDIIHSIDSSHSSKQPMPSSLQPLQPVMQGSGSAHNLNCSHCPARSPLAGFARGHGAIHASATLTSSPAGGGELARQKEQLAKRLAGRATPEPSTCRAAAASTHSAHTVEPCPVGSPGSAHAAHAAVAAAVSKLQLPKEQQQKAASIAAALSALVRSRVSAGDANTAASIGATAAAVQHGGLQHKLSALSAAQRDQLRKALQRAVVQKLHQQSQLPASRNAAAAASSQRAGTPLQQQMACQVDPQQHMPAIASSITATGVVTAVAAVAAASAPAAQSALTCVGEPFSGADGGTPLNTPSKWIALCSNSTCMPNAPLQSSAFPAAAPVMSAGFVHTEQLSLSHLGSEHSCFGGPDFLLPPVLPVSMAWEAPPAPMMQQEQQQVPLDRPQQQQQMQHCSLPLSCSPYQAPNMPGQQTVLQLQNAAPAVHAKQQQCQIQSMPPPAAFSPATSVAQAGQPPMQLLWQQQQQQRLSPAPGTTTSSSICSTNECRQMPATSPNTAGEDQQDFNEDTLLAVLLDSDPSMTWQHGQLA